jgi:hypothetical protein
LEKGVKPRDFRPRVSINAGRKSGIEKGFAVPISAVRSNDIPQNTEVLPKSFRLRHLLKEKNGERVTGLLGS